MDGEWTNCVDMAHTSNDIYDFALIIITNMCVFAGSIIVVVAFI